MIDTIKNFKMTFNKALIILFIVLFAMIAIINPVFLYPDYLINVMLKNIVEIGLMALPVTLIVISGGIDLSVGSIMVLSAMIGGMVAASFGSLAGILISLAVGALCGLINGVIIVKCKISPLVTTLATMFLFMGIARGISLGDNVYSYQATEILGTFEIMGIPIQILIYALFAVVFCTLLSRTILGRSIYAIGLNENATKYTGIKTDNIKLWIYILSGVICALAAMIWLGRFTSIKYDAGTNLNLKVVTVIVLGGTSIDGGVGDMKGTVIATMIIALLNSGLTVLNIPIDTQTIVHGTVLIISLFAYSYLNERVKKNKIIKLKLEDNSDESVLQVNQVS
jgi:ribose/xylose/arabinose/galactoside ABC-type transport system permease subunit